MSSRPMRAAAVASVLFFAVPVLATVVIAQTLEEMAHAAPLIVRGRVGGSQASWDDQHQHIETFTEVVVTEVLKGQLSPGNALMIREPGGEVGGVGMHVEGVAHFTPDEEVVLFLEPARDDPRVYLTAALAAGKVSLKPNSLGEVRALRDLRGLSFLKAGSRAPAVRAVDHPEDLGTPEQFVARLKKAIGGAR